MRRIAAILGTFVIAVMVIISSSVVAQSWHFGDHIEGSQNCTNPDYAVGAPDTYNATLGQNPDVEGWLVIDLGAGNEMGPNQEFWVYSSSAYYEEYNVTIFTINNQSWTEYGAYGDTTDHNFTTPNNPGDSWRYILLEFNTGVPYQQGDRIYGPEIDAVGWYG